MSRGITSTVDIAKKLGISITSVNRKLVEYGLADEKESATRLWNGVIVHHLESGKLLFARNTKVTGDFIGCHWQSVVNALNRSSHHVKGHKVYRVRQWIQEFPTFYIDEKELLQNDIVQVA